MLKNIVKDLKTPREIEGQIKVIDAENLEKVVGGRHHKDHDRNVFDEGPTGWGH